MFGFPKHKLRIHLGKLKHTPDTIPKALLKDPNMDTCYKRDILGVPRTSYL